MGDVISKGKIAFLAMQGVENSELAEPWKAVKEDGFEPVLISAEPGTIQAMEGDWEHSDTYTVDLTWDEAKVEDFVGLVLPGGTLNADAVRAEEGAKKIAHAFMEADKPVAPICHGAWVLVETDDVKGRTMTSVPRIKTDLINAGAEWVDEEFHAEGNLHTSRSPRDLEAFNKGILEAFNAAAK